MKTTLWNPSKHEFCKMSCFGRMESGCYEPKSTAKPSILKNYWHSTPTFVSLPAETTKLPQNRLWRPNTSFLHLVCCLRGGRGIILGRVSTALYLGTLPSCYQNEKPGPEVLITVDSCHFKNPKMCRGTSDGVEFSSQRSRGCAIPAWLYPLWC